MHKSLWRDRSTTAGTSLRLQVALSPAFQFSTTRGQHWFTHERVTSADGYGFIQRRERIRADALRLRSDAPGASAQLLSSPRVHRQSCTQKDTAHRHIRRSIYRRHRFDHMHLIIGVRSSGESLQEFRANQRPEIHQIHIFSQWQNQKWSEGFFSGQTHDEIHTQSSNMSAAPDPLKTRRSRISDSKMIKNLS